MRWCVLLVSVLAVSCVERKLHIRTEPEGALVQVNGRDVGRSPTTWTFTHYGTVRVTASLEGHVPEQRLVKLKMPWYQYPVADFFSDLVVPARIRDEHEVTLALQPSPDLPREEAAALAEEIAGRAVELRERMRRLAAAEEREKTRSAEPRPAEADAPDYE